MINSAHKKIPCLSSGTKKAAETKALYLQGYNVATDRLKEILQTPSDKPYSIVLDLDETVFFRQQPLPSSKRQRWYGLQS